MTPLRTSLILILTALGCAAETRVRITGTAAKSEGQLLGLIGGRLEHVRMKDASLSRADDAAFLLTQVMRRDGYSGVRVTPRVVSRSEILLIVIEGGRRSLGTVTVTGVADAQAGTLAKLYSRPAEKERPMGSGTPPFREEDVEEGLSNIRQELNAQGFWAAEAAITSQVTDPATGVVSIGIAVRQGAMHTIGKAEIISPDGRGLVRTKTTTAPFVGRPATTANLNEQRLAVEEAFTSRGYPDAKISLGRKILNATYIPSFYIDLGKRVRLRQIHLVGLDRTNPKAVLSRLQNLEGEWYDEAAMNRRLRGFLASGAFSSVRVETGEVSRKRIDATLHFEEAEAREVSLALGADSYQGALFRATYADRNLLGRLMGFRTGFEFSARGVLGETSITDPWLFGSDISGTARLFALSYGREGYGALELGADGKISRKFGDHYTLELLAGYSVVELTEDGLPAAELGETNYTHPMLRVTQSLDFRDSAILPTKGWHLRFPLEIGSAVGDVTTSYVSAGLDGGWYHRINADYQIGIGGELGILVPFGGDEELPIDLRLFNGGSRSVRSFPDRELGPTVNGFPTGGEAMWNTNFELTRRLGKSLKAVAFVDAGSLAKDYDDFAAGEIEMAVGLGLRLDLPVGPVRLEYGYNLTRDGDEPVGTIHFAIGAAF